MKLRLYATVQSDYSKGFPFDSYDEYCDNIKDSNYYRKILVRYGAKALDFTILDWGDSDDRYYKCFDIREIEVELWFQGLGLWNDLALTEKKSLLIINNTLGYPKEPDFTGWIKSIKTGKPLFR